MERVGDSIVNKFFRKLHGFTLIELMIVVAVVGLLAAVAYPSYVEQINKSNRATATDSVLTCAAILERRFTLNSTYGPAAGNNLCANVTNDDYTLTVVANTISLNGNSNGFVVTATASSANTLGDSQCRTFTYSEQGQKTATAHDASLNTNKCWGI